MEAYSESNIAFEAKVKTNCEHCGLPVLNDAVFVLDKVFCCKGCASVFSLLNENDLCQYYAEGNGILPELSLAGDFDFLNDPETESHFIVFKNNQIRQFKFTIPGMHCNACIYLLERLEKLNDNILSSRVDFFNKELLVDVNDDKIHLSELVDLLNKLGYKPDLTLSVDQVKSNKKNNSKALKIGIAGFCFGNIMMLSFPEYLGLSLDAASENLKYWFNLLSFGLALPVLFYSAQEFFVSSYKSIKQKTLVIDLPIALAILATFLRSVFEIFVNHQSGYFDSMTGIVFLLLVGRYFQDLTYDSLTFDRDYKSYFPLAARLITHSESKMVNIKTLECGDVIELRNSELLPADALLLSDVASLDYSFITGESNPVGLKKGDKVYAGAKVFGHAVQLSLLASTDNSRLVKLWANESKDSKIKNNSLTAQINFYFTLSLLIISALTFVYQFQLNGWKAGLMSLTSVLIVACPCILLLASSFANGYLLRGLKHQGMFVKNKGTLTDLLNLDTIIFDKTGTLTDHVNFEILNETTLSDADLNELAYVCRQSVHPYSTAIAKHFLNSQFSCKVQSFKDVIGKGVMGIVNGRLFKLGSADFLDIQELKSSDFGIVHLSLDNIYSGCFKLKNSIRKDVNSMTDKLKSMGYELHLASGDNKITNEINTLNFDSVQLKQSPENKVALIQDLKSNGRMVAMTGDGLNDAPALGAANVAIAVADNENSFFPACDVLLMSNSVSILPELLLFVKRSKWVIIISFVFSLIYNVIGLYFAVTGQLSPLLAAILMPSSSISMLILTWVLSYAISKFTFNKA